MTGMPARRRREPALKLAGDSLLLVEFGSRIAPSLNARAVRLADVLRAARIPGVRDVVPAYCTVGVHFDPLATDRVALEETVRDAARLAGHEPGTSGRVIEIPVCYGGAYGPDLGEVADWAGLAQDEVVRRHAARTYRVYMLGFLPGFAYMASVDRRIAIPRHRVPRERVSAGSVGIAGEQTGVYPAASPGGWHIIGRTPVAMFDLARAEPSLCRPGDRVRFRRISTAEFEELAANVADLVQRRS